MSPLLSTFGAGSVRGFRPGASGLPAPTSIDIVMSSAGENRDNSQNTPYYAFGGNAGGVAKKTGMSISAGTYTVNIGGSGFNTSFNNGAGSSLLTASASTSSATLKSDADAGTNTFYNRGAEGMTEYNGYFPYNPGGAASSGGSGTNGDVWYPGTSGPSVPTSFTPSSISPIITVGGVGGTGIGYIYDTNYGSLMWTAGGAGTKYTSSSAGNGVSYWRTSGQNWSSSTATNGVVAFSHPKTFKQGVITGLNNSVTISGNYYVYVFNSSGTVTW